MESNKLKMSYSLGLVDDIKKLDEKTKEELLFQMLSEMSNDKNSSTFREGVSKTSTGRFDPYTMC